MLPRDYRWVAIGDLIIRKDRRAPDGVPDFSIEDLVSCIRDRQDNNNIRRIYSNKECMMWCQGVHDDGRYLKMLLHRADKNVSGLSFVDFETFATKDINKLENEGGVFSSHVVIDLNADVSGRCMIVVEKVPGIYLGSVSDYFTWAMNGDAYFKHAPNGAKGRAIVDVEGRASQTLREAMLNGKIKDIEFVTYNLQDQGLDEDPVIEREVNNVRWFVGKRLGAQRLDSLWERARSTYNIFRAAGRQAEVFVSIKLDNGTERKTALDMDAEAALEQAFVRNEQISGFEVPLNVRHEVVRADVVAKMIHAASPMELEDEAA